MRAGGRRAVVAIMAGLPAAGEGQAPLPIAGSRRCAPGNVKSITLQEEPVRLELPQSTYVRPLTSARGDAAIDRAIGRGGVRSGTSAPMCAWECEVDHPARRSGALGTTAIELCEAAHVCAGRRSD